MSELDRREQLMAAMDAAEDGTLEPVEEAPAPLQAPQDGVLTDEQLAAQYRSQADALFKEAQSLRKQAEELVPTKKTAATKKTTQGA